MKHLFKKVISFVAAILVITLSASPIGAATPTTIKISLNGNPLTFDAKPKPRIVNGRILIPVASLAKELGATTDWIPDTKSVIITLHKKDTLQTIYLKIGQASAIVNGMEVELDAAATIYDNRAFIPLRFVSENLGAKVEWNSKTKTVNITYDIPVKDDPPILIPPWKLEQYQTTSSAIRVIK